MVDNLHRLIKSAEIATPLILVGSELGSLNGRFYSHIHDSEVSDLVLINPIPDDLFEEDQWRQYWYTNLVPSLQVMQFSAATGLNRMFIILGLMQPALRGEGVSQVLEQRQKYYLSNPAHQSSAVDEHFFLNESVSQLVAKLQKKCLEQLYPTAQHIRVYGADRRMIYKNPSAISEHLTKMIAQRQSKQQSQ
ncbi:hypothetical protein JZ751_026046 [Albula glossodonta]|uniref:Uncharacterized protein n=1 Tax=Albula glossodonta TaxID=121402 RepID=A0A8T2NH36_9TELE|nr:hypothetical protein JZ751_026046 [Albula glossodonta]